MGKLTGAALLCFLAVALAAPSWSIIADRVATILMGVGFADDGITGYASGGQDGAGPVILKSTDGGASWGQVPFTGAAMMFLDTAVTSPRNALVGGLAVLYEISGIQYTRNGEQFVPTKDKFLTQTTQNVERVRGTRDSIAIVGGFDKGDGVSPQVNGIALSKDGGETLTYHDIQIDVGARYGSFPSPDVWYVTAGTWPDMSSHKAGRANHRLSERLGVTANPNTKRIKHGLHTRKQSNDGYIAAVVKTTDGGKTFTEVFRNDTTFYPNGISCPTVNDCWFVAEGDGIKVFHTSNGGRTWEVQMEEKNPSFSLMGLSFVNGKEGFLFGGELKREGFQGHAYHTVDGGNTWKTDIIPGVYLTRGYFHNTTLGYATAFTEDGLSSILRYN